MSETDQLSSLRDLGEQLRVIEKETGQPSRLIASVGDDKYLIGNLIRRN